jgi:serine/threonine protein kinase
MTPAQTLGPYQIVEKLGEGGMGEVYRAHDPRVGRDVAIKIAASSFTERFEREGRAVAALNHVNICQLYDVGAVPSGPGYLVMELVEGPTLAEVIAGKGALPVDEALEIARQIAAALEAAHDKGNARPQLGIRAAPVEAVEPTNVSAPPVFARELRRANGRRQRSTVEPTDPHRRASPQRIVCRRRKYRTSGQSNRSTSVRQTAAAAFRN